MSLTSKAMLVRMSIGKWYNRVFDKRISDEVALKYAVANSEDKYVKTLISSAALRGVEAAIGEIRKYHYENTLPWAQDSVRILPSAKYMDYVAKMAQLESQFKIAVTAFAEKYPDWVAAAKLDKKALFDASQYPDQHSIGSHFRLDIAFLPFPDAGDFRIDLDPVEMQKITTDTKKAINDTMKDASKHLVDRIRVRLQTLHEAISVPAKIFRDTTVTSVTEIVELAEELNIADDDNVRLVCGAVRTICDKRLTPDALRTNMVYRHEMAGKIKEVLDSMQGL